MLRFPFPCRTLNCDISSFSSFENHFFDIQGLLTSSDRMGSPKELFGAKGTFYDMVQHSGEVKELQGVFGDSDE